MPKCLLKGVQQDSESAFGGHISIFTLYQNHLTVRLPPRLQGPLGQDCPNHFCTLVWPGLLYDLNEWLFSANELNEWLVQDRLLTIT